MGEPGDLQAHGRRATLRSRQVTGPGVIEMDLRYLVTGAQVRQSGHGHGVVLPVGSPLDGVSTFPSQWRASYDIHCDGSTSEERLAITYYGIVSQVRVESTILPQPTPAHLTQPHPSPPLRSVSSTLVPAAHESCSPLSSPLGSPLARTGSTSTSLSPRPRRARVGSRRCWALAPSRSTLPRRGTATTSPRRRAGGHNPLPS